MTTVINIKYYKDKDYVYCGRPSIYGNPYTHIKNKETLAEHICNSREESIEMFKKYFYNRLKTDLEFKSMVLQLKDKKLGCFCAPQNCHCEIIAQYLDSAEKTS